MSSAESSSEISVLFVCMGNICRSPTAEAVFRRLLQEEGLEDRVRVDSAGTHDYHVGRPADRRAAAAAMERGYDLGELRARQVGAEDLNRFHYVIAMDRANLEMLRALSHGPDASTDALRLELLRDYIEGEGGRDVPDPYYGGANGFEEVLDIVEAGSRALLERIRERHGL